MVGIIIYVLFGPILVVVEEFIIGSETFMAVQKMQKMGNGLKDSDGNMIEFDDLNSDMKTALVEYYESIERKIDRRMMIMAKESSIQLVYQKALLVYQLIYQPLLELDFTYNGSIKPARIASIQTKTEQNYRKM